MTRSILVVLGIAMMSSLASAQSELEGTWKWKRMECEVAPSVKTGSTVIISGEIAFSDGLYAYDSTVENPVTAEQLAQMKRGIENLESAIVTIDESARASAEAQLKLAQANYASLNRPFIQLRVEGKYTVEGSTLRTTTTAKNGQHVQDSKSKINHFAVEGGILRLFSMPQEGNSGACTAGDRLVTIFERVN